MTVFEAGVAVRDITPGPGLALWGYMDRNRPASGTLDPLFARAIVFRAGGETVGLVTLDLGRMPLRAVCERIRERVAKAGVNRLIICASHTHHAPVMEVDDAPHVRAMEAAIGDAIEEANAKRQPARIGVGRATVDIAHNRRVIRDGRCYMFWRNEERLPTSPVDPEAGIVKIEAADGKPLAVLVNLACHPVVLGPTNIEYSADFCGEMARIVKDKTGAECFFLQGASGDLNPYLDKTPVHEGGVEAMRGVGGTCAEAVLSALDGIAATKPVSPSVEYVEKPVEVGTRWDFSDPEVQGFFRGMYRGLFDSYLEHLTRDMSVPLGVLMLNRSLALVFVPGEPFVRFQLDLKSGSPLADTFLCGYANEFHLYMPTVRDAAAGGYGGSTATYVGLGAGDRLITEAQIEIGRMLGAFRAAPAREDFRVAEYDTSRPEERERV